MRPDQNPLHADHVNQWIQTTLSGLSREGMVRTFGLALSRLRQRAAITLSDVTLAAILDRAHHISQQKYPLLSELKIETGGIQLGQLVTQADRHTSEEIAEAFQGLLVEFITILGNLTADILTQPLYTELLKVTAEGPRSLSNPKSADRGSK